MLADLDDLLTALYVLVDDFLPRRPRARRRPRITDAELICLAVAQVLLGLPQRAALPARSRRWRLGHLFPYLPKQPGYNKRLRALAPQIARVLNLLARQLAVVVRRPPAARLHAGAVRQLARDRQALGASPATPPTATARSHSRYFWGFRLYLLCAPDGMPIAFELAPANAPEREVAAEMLERVELDGYTVIADKGFAGEEFETLDGRPRRALPAPRPQATSTARFGSLGGIRQWIESIFDSSRASSRSNATAPAPCRLWRPASPNACSHSPPASGTTGTSATPAATSPPTTTDRRPGTESVI